MRVRIAIASGKGGTGKTTVAVNLAVTLARNGHAVAYVDCDVEAPNGHLFLRPVVDSETPVGRLVPRVDHDRCLLCGECARSCRFNAIVCLPGRVLVYDDLCHSCGGCVLACPRGAITEVSRPLGVVKTGAAGAVRFVSGTLGVGEATSPPVIRAAKAAAPAVEWTIFDAPPGTACPMIETVRDCDFVLLVTEPTPFGLHDLRLALEVTDELGLRRGVVVNRSGHGAGETRELCLRRGVPILAEIPDSPVVARAYARGELAVDSVPGFQRLFDLLEQAVSEAIREGARPPAACEVP